MIAPRSESLIRLRDVPDLPWMPRPNGHRLHVSTIYRWCHRGINGSKLDSIKVGGALYTTEEALHEFFVRSTSAG